MILVSFFSKDNALSDEIKTCYFLGYENNENQAFRLFGTGPEYAYRKDQIHLFTSNFNNAHSNS